MNTLSRKSCSALLSAMVVSATAFMLAAAPVQSAIAKTEQVLAVDQSDTYVVKLHKIRLIPVEDPQYINGRIVHETVVGANISAAFTNTSDKDIEGIEFVVQVQVCEYDPVNCLRPVTPIRGQYIPYQNPIKAGQTREISGGSVLTELALVDVKGAIAGRLPVKIRITAVHYAGEQEARRAQYVAQQQADAARREDAKKDAATYDEMIQKVREINAKYRSQVSLQGLIGSVIAGAAEKKRAAEVTAVASQYGYLYDARTDRFTKDPYAQTAQLSQTTGQSQATEPAQTAAPDQTTQTSPVTKPTE